MAIKSQVHAHKYKKIALGNKGYEVFKCQKAGCPHYIRKELVVGMIAECWRCGREVVMNNQMAHMVKPRCVSCISKHGNSLEAKANKEVA